MTATDETFVREALHRATDDLAAPVHRLTEASTRNGRRLRRRRRILAAAGSLAVVAGVAAPVIILAGQDGRTGNSIATDPTTSLPEPVPTEGQVGWWQMPATQMLVHLKDLSPEGLSFADAVLTNDDRAPGEQEGVLRGWVQADVVAAGRTAGSINVMLMPPELKPPEPATDPVEGDVRQPKTATDDASGTVLDPDQANVPVGQWLTCPGNLTGADTCTPVLGADGTPIGRTSTTTMGSVTVLEVVLRGPGDGLVYVAASNSADDKWGEGSSVAAEHVPLTLAQVREIATDPVWTSWGPPAGP